MLLAGRILISIGIACLGIMFWEKSVLVGNIFLLLAIFTLYLAIRIRREEGPDA